ncbi:UNVERIFIED_CONTAM: hypothetical protein K2H54_061640 [Gekko kuhli]
MKGRLEIMRDSFFSIEAKFLLAMRAVSELSKFQPLISRDLRTSMVAWALGLVLGGSPAGHEDAGDQARGRPITSSRVWQTRLPLLSPPDG